MTPRSRALLAASAWVAMLSTLPTGAQGATSTLLECLEGADFIANAAASRDNGLERGVFLDRLEGDFVAIRAFPVALRCSSRTPTTRRSCAPPSRTSTTARSTPRTTTARSSPPA